MPLRANNELADIGLHLDPAPLGYCDAARVLATIA
jgi:hypothetical protein